MTAGARIATADIETLPIQAYVWSLFQEPRALDRVVKDWAIFSGAFKWLGGKKVHYMDTQPKDDCRDDYDLVYWLCEMLDEADIVVGHNMQKFDIRKIRARALQHGIPPFREPEVVDTMLMAREIGAFTSNKLEYLSGALTDSKKSLHAKYPGFALWDAVMKGEAAAWREVKDYNKQDIRSTEALYLRLRPWARRHPNMSHYFDDEIMRCPRCGSSDMLDNGIIHRGVSEYNQYRCGGCGGHSRSRYTGNSIEKRRNILTLF